MNALRVLVIEDDALLGFMLGEVVEEFGYKVLAIETTQAGAVAAARTTRPDLMIVDVRLQSGNGIAAVTEICANGFVPHVFLTGDMAEVQSQRPDAIAIHKPFLEADLARAISRAMTMATG